MRNLKLFVVCAFFAPACETETRVQTRVKMVEGSGGALEHEDRWGDVVIGFPFDRRNGHTMIEDPDQHEARGVYERNIDLDCTRPSGSFGNLELSRIGAPISGIVLEGADRRVAGHDYFQDGVGCYTSGYGNRICLENIERGLICCVNHLESVQLHVQPGDWVEQGQYIADCGCSGNTTPLGADGSHLDIFCTDLAGNPVEMAHPDQWTPLASLRVRLRRLYWSNGHGCRWPWHDWDHCFSMDGVNCIGENQGGGTGYVHDGASLEIYPLEIGRGAETIQVGPHTIARLESCYHADFRWHVYVTFDSREYLDLSASPDWTCAPVGYVRTGTPLSGATLVYRLQLDTATTTAYTTDPNEANGLPSLGCVFEQNGAWYAWTPIDSEITIAAAFAEVGDESENEAEAEADPVCGNGVCENPETCSTCSADCGDCCGDGSCNGDEDCASCPGDCGGCSSEICDGVDNDSDGIADESLARGCSTACGTGTETCMSGTWCGCTASLPFFEICNGLDDDCDGDVDEDCYDTGDESISYPPRCPENNRISNPGFEGPLGEWPRDHWGGGGEGARLVRDCEISYEGSCSGRLTGCSGSGSDPQVAQNGIPTIAGLNEICFCARANVPTEVSIFVARTYVGGSITFVDSVRVLEDWRCFCTEHEMEAEDVLRFSFNGGSARTVWFDTVHLGGCAPEEPCERCVEFCGDGFCHEGEDCFSCPADCGACPRETCDGVDNDLDGLVDELLTRPCSTRCGSGTETCVSGAWQNCTALVPSSEICDGVDNDCNGSTDEAQGSTTCGLGVCEHTQANCVSGTLIDCDSFSGASLETCNGLDDDCNGAVDEGCECVNGDEQECSIDPCGNSGTQTCTDGAWSTCNAPECPSGLGELAITCYSNRPDPLDTQDLSGMVIDQEGIGWSWRTWALLNGTDAPIVAEVELPVGHSFAWSVAYDGWWSCHGATLENHTIMSPCTATWDGGPLEITRRFDGAGCGFRVTAPPESVDAPFTCGNGVCEYYETCSSCQTDCGQCVHGGTLRLEFTTPDGDPADSICLSYCANPNRAAGSCWTWLPNVRCWENTRRVTHDLRLGPDFPLYFSFEYSRSGLPRWSCEGSGVSARANGLVEALWTTLDGRVSGELSVRPVSNGGSGCNLEVVTP